jgi:hypothetical protein
MIYDSQMGFEFRRVRYDVQTTRRKIKAKGLPLQLAGRLEQGL